MTDGINQSIYQSIHQPIRIHQPQTGSHQHTACLLSPVPHHLFLTAVLWMCVWRRGRKGGGGRRGEGEGERGRGKKVRGGRAHSRPHTTERRNLHQYSPGSKVDCLLPKPRGLPGGGGPPFWGHVFTSAGPDNHARQQLQRFWASETESTECFRTEHRISEQRGL